MTITSADPLHEAVLTNFAIGESSGLNFSKLEFQANGGRGSSWGFQVNDSQNITFDHLNVHGTDANPQNDAEGIGIWGSANVSITNSEFHQLARGATFGEGSNLTVTGNSFHDLRTTGLMIAQTAKADISHNSFTNFKIVAGDHPDAIQFLTEGTTSASHDLNITDNLITRGTGDAAQGIFLNDEVGTLHYTNVNIANNLLIGSGYNGIAVLGGQNVAITNNTLDSLPGDTNVTWVMVQSSDTVTASGNTAKSFIFDQDTHLTETGDAFNVAVTDNGQAALAAWNQAHGGAAGGGDTGGGGGGGQSLLGDSHSTHLTGGAGNDTIDGGSGYDTLTGGAGVDVFHITPRGAYDVITDFGTGGADVLDISGYLKMGLKPVFHDVGHSVALTFSNGDSISITGVNSWNLHPTAVGFTA